MSLFDDNIEVIAIWIIAIGALIFAINKTLKLGKGEKCKDNELSSLANDLIKQLPQLKPSPKNGEDAQFAQIQSQLKELQNRLSNIQSRQDKLNAASELVELKKNLSTIQSGLTKNKKR